MTKDRAAARRQSRLVLSGPQWQTLLVTWSTYGSFYFCRVNIGPANKSIQESLAVSAVEMGFVLGAIKIGYAIGQLVNGQLAERFGPKRVLMIGMFGSIVATLLFAFCASIASLPGGPGALGWLSDALTRFLRLFSSSSNLSIGPMASLLLVIAFVNGYSQAGGWPPTVKIMANWFSVEQRGRLMGVIGTSYQIGSALTIFAAGLLISAYGSWRAAFVVPAAALSISALHTLLRLRASPEVDEPKRSGAAKEKGGREGAWSTLRSTVTNGPIWILALGLFGLDIVRYGFLDWAPAQLQEAHRTGAMQAALKIAVLPLAGALGALVSGWLSDRFFQSRRAPVITLMLIVTAALTLAYPHLVPLGVAPTVVCLALIGFFLYGAQILLVGTAAQDFARRGATAAAAGFVDFTGSMGAFGGDVVTGWMRQNYGWSGALAFWAGSALFAALLVGVLWRARPLERS